MVAVNSSSPIPPGMWEAQATGDAGAIGDSSAESLYVQGKQAQGHCPGGVVYHCESKKGVRIDTEHQQLNVEL